MQTKSSQFFKWLSLSEGPPFPSYKCSFYIVLYRSKSGIKDSNTYGVSFYFLRSKQSNIFSLHRYFKEYLISALITFFTSLHRWWVLILVVCRNCLEIVFFVEIVGGCRDGRYSTIGGDCLTQIAPRITKHPDHVQARWKKSP